MTERNFAGMLPALTDDITTAPYPAGDTAPPPDAGTRPAAMLSYRDNAAPVDEPAAPYLVAGNCRYIPAVYDRDGVKVGESKTWVDGAEKVPAEPTMTLVPVYTSRKAPQQPASVGAWALLCVLLMAWAAWAVIR